jgi:hypothetical protein
MYNVVMPFGHYYFPPAIKASLLRSAPTVRLLPFKVGGHGEGVAIQDEYFR